MAKKSGGRPGTAGSFRATNNSFGNSFNDRDEGGMSQYIANFNDSSPRSKSMKVREYIVGELKSKNMDPSRIFAMAGPDSSGAVQWKKIFQSLPKVCPSINAEFIEEAYKALDVEANELITKDDFCAQFGSGRRMSSSPDKGSARKMQNK